YYADLDVSRGATTEDSKRAYRRAARKLHTGGNPSPEGDEQFKKVTQAYDVLSDPEKRRSCGKGAGQYAAGAASLGQGFSFSDIMDAFFGAGAGAASGRGPRPRRQRGQDGLVRMDIDLRTAVFGGEEDLVIDTAILCATCHGEGSQPGTGRRTCDI